MGPASGTAQLRVVGTSPAQVVGTSRMLGASCPPLAWSFSHLTGPGDGKPGQEMPGLHLRASPQEGSCHPWHCITCSMWEPRQPSQLSHHRSLPVAPVTLSPGSSATSKRIPPSLGPPRLRGWTDRLHVRLWHVEPHQARTCCLSLQSVCEAGSRTVSSRHWSPGVRVRSRPPVGIQGSSGSAPLSAPRPSSVQQSHSEHTCLLCSHALLPPNERGLFLEQTPGVAL